MILLSKYFLLIYLFLGSVSTLSMHHMASTSRIGNNFKINLAKHSIRFYTRQSFSELQKLEEKRTTHLILIKYYSNKKDLCQTRIKECMKDGCKLNCENNPEIFICTNEYKHHKYLLEEGKKRLFQIDQQIYNLIYEL